MCGRGKINAGDDGELWANLFVHKQDLESVGRWHRDDIHYSHLMSILAPVIVLSVQHLLLREKRDGWGKGLQGDS